MTYNMPLEPSIFAQVLHMYVTGESVRFNKWSISASCTPSSYRDVIGRGSPTEDRKLLPCPGRVPDLHPHTVNVQQSTHIILYVLLS